jgi:hypothetical protein
LELLGKTFGELTVLERVEERSVGGYQWRCLCSCGNECVVLGTLLTTGRVTHCTNKEAHRHLMKYKTSDITGQKIGQLTALYPTEKRSKKGAVIWHCRCDCGNEVDVSLGDLLYTRLSCGCKKRENDIQLHNTLTHVAGTTLEMIKSKKIPKSNTSGCRGVYLIRGKYIAKIVFQRKQYQLGSFSTLEEAADARKEAEKIIFDRSAEFLESWKERADADPKWAKENPVSIRVNRDSAGDLNVTFLPLL